eukprot:COSAG02_NODE_282_length_25773_cov_1666.149762_12_plen_157_part_00
MIVISCLQFSLDRRNSDHSGRLTITNKSTTVVRRCAQRALDRCSNAPPQHSTIVAAMSAYYWPLPRIRSRLLLHSQYALDPCTTFQKAFASRSFCNECMDLQKMVKDHVLKVQGLYVRDALYWNDRGSAGHRKLVTSFPRGCCSLWHARQQLHYHL